MAKLNTVDPGSSQGFMEFSCMQPSCSFPASFVALTGTNGQGVAHTRAHSNHSRKRVSVTNYIFQARADTSIAHENSNNKVPALGA